MIVDAVMFNSEWECLEIRTRELRGLVNIILVVEGDRTFTGNPKPPADLTRLLNISTNIIRTRVSLGEAANPWDAETRQRNGIIDGMNSVPGLTGDDLILVSDCDEIPRRSEFEKAVAMIQHRQQICFCLEQFYYRLNWRDPADVVGTCRLLKAKDITLPQRLRAIRPRAHETPLERSGWHFGWLGTPAENKTKIESFAHVELNTPDIANVAFLETCQRLRMTAHNNRHLQKLPIDDSFPIDVRERPGRYAHLVDA